MTTQRGFFFRDESSFRVFCSETMTAMAPPRYATPNQATSLEATSAAFDAMLSQLLFVSEMPAEEIEKVEDAAFWNGLFCFNFNESDRDLFFDALQESVDDEDSNDEPPSISGMAAMRGGAVEEPQGDGMYHPQHSPTKPDINGDHGAETGQREDITKQPMNPFTPLVSPPAPEELPVRFLGAGKGDPEEGQRRYEATLQWRKENGMDTIIVEPHPNVELIKRNYPHYYHLKGYNGEPVFFELPPKTNLQAMRDGGVTLTALLRHYALVTEFQWQYLTRDDLARSITVLDLEGMRMMDFVGECVEYVRKCSEFTGQHYPERAGFVYVINVPGWFAMIWKAVKPMVDEVTLQKINILRGKEEIFAALSEKIPIENIPPEYGGKSMPLGESPEEHVFRDFMLHNLAKENGDFSCGGRAANPPCKFCNWVASRSY